ncbi:hypothetical protein NUW54_g10000 [Trametes sanguinea]|uniref:Uncharacterized protein n=1 Tax=Trametes sanguinea TaxID=158606 RepID=A0ACC1P3U4_9APHY|nr:hypothetical protein NUW54_g10000 [Trametes sanguinea]
MYPHPTPTVTATSSAHLHSAPTHPIYTVQLPPGHLHGPPVPPHVLPLLPPTSHISYPSTPQAASNTPALHDATPHIINVHEPTRKRTAPQAARGAPSHKPKQQRKHPPGVGSTIQIPIPDNAPPATVTGPSGPIGIDPDAQTQPAPLRC